MLFCLKESYSIDNTVQADVEKPRVSDQDQTSQKPAKEPAILIHEDDQIPPARSEENGRGINRFQAKRRSLFDLRGSEKDPIEFDIDPPPGSVPDDELPPEDRASGNALLDREEPTNLRSSPSAKLESTQGTTIDLSPNHDELHTKRQLSFSPSLDGNEPANFAGSLSDEELSNLPSREQLKYWCQKRDERQLLIDPVQNRLAMLESQRDRYQAKQDVLRAIYPNMYTRLPQFSINKSDLGGNSGRRKQYHRRLELHNKCLQKAKNKIGELMRAGWLVEENPSS